MAWKVTRTWLVSLFLSALALSLTCPAYASVWATEAWMRRYNGTGNGIDTARAVAVDGNGNVYVIGWSRGSDTGDDYVTISYAHDGTERWVRRYNGPGSGNDLALDVAIDGSGNVYVTGSSWDRDTGYDYATISYAPDGTERWVRRYNGAGNGNDSAVSVVVDGSGNVYVTGTSRGDDTGDDYATISYAPDGTERWIRRYNALGNGNDSAMDVAIDGSGNVYVTGASIGNGTAWDYALVSYASDGTERWVRRYTGAGSSEDIARSVAVDGSGNVYVTGWSRGSGTDYDYTTISYAHDGRERWIRRYNGPGNGEDTAQDMAVDGSGNVYVTGSSWDRDTGYDYATISYASDGTERWVRRYTGPGNSNARGNSLAVDQSGNVYVVGWTGNGDTGADGTTVGYSADGTERWVRRHTGSVIVSVAVDGSGNVYVTGYSVGSGTTSDYTTIKYSEVPNADPVVSADKLLTLNEDDPNTPLGIAAPMDADGDPLTITVTAVPDSSRAFVRRSGGGAVVVANDVLTISELIGLELELVPNAHGDAGSFQYAVSDGKNGTASQTLVIGILPVNDAPVVQEEGYATSQSTLLVVSAPGILGNDGDVEGDPLVARLVSGPTSGDLTLNADGSFRYTPRVGFIGTDTFTYQASDGAAVSAPATVTITVSAEPPAATDKARVQGNGKLGTGKKAPSFSLNVRVLASGKIKGKVQYKNAGTVLQSTRLTSVVVNGAHARIFGEGKLKGAGTVAFVLDVYDQSRTKADRKQGKADRFQLQTSGAVSVPETALTQGNLRVW